jgi:hypothetical protein
MSERGVRLLEMSQEQITELIDLLSRGGRAALALPCPGRQKLGDGTVGAVARHTAENYCRIADYLKAPGDVGRSDANGAHRRHHAVEHVDLEDLLSRLPEALDALGRLAELDDAQLNSVPVASDMRFADGQRTLEQILTGLLRHQGHQVDALRRALA